MLLDTKSRHAKMKRSEMNFQRLANTFVLFVLSMMLTTATVYGQAKNLSPTDQQLFDGLLQQVERMLQADELEAVVLAEAQSHVGLIYARIGNVDAAERVIAELPDAKIAKNVVANIEKLAFESLLVDKQFETASQRLLAADEFNVHLASKLIDAQGKAEQLASNQQLLQQVQDAAVPELQLAKLKVFVELAKASSFAQQNPKAARRALEKAFAIRDSTLVQQRRPLGWNSQQFQRPNVFAIITCAIESGFADIAIDWLEQNPIDLDHMFHNVDEQLFVAGEFEMADHLLQRMWDELADVAGEARQNKLERMFRRYVKLARIAQEAGSAIQAEIWFRRAMEIAEEHSIEAPNLELARLHLLRGESELASEQFNALVQYGLQNNKNSLLRNLFFRYLDWIDDRQELFGLELSAETFQDWTDRSNTGMEISRRLIKELQSRNRTEDARAICQQLWELAKDYPASGGVSAFGLRTMNSSDFAKCMSARSWAEIGEVEHVLTAVNSIESYNRFEVMRLSATVLQRVSPNHQWLDSIQDLDLKAFATIGILQGRLFGENDFGNTVLRH